jgi:murein L,D-transpeptidase YafK
MRSRSRNDWLALSCAGLAAIGWAGDRPAAAATATARPDVPVILSPEQLEVLSPKARVPDYSPAARERRLAEGGFTSGSPIMIRIFKQESTLELWMQKEGRFERFATYPICFWSGKLGPKLREGDKQAPEGFYSVNLQRLYPRGRRPRSFDIGFPNLLDRSFGRTGSYIFVHGGCTSTGCFAMTDQVMSEIYTITERALQEGQQRIEVHAFPFRMTETNLAAHAESEWYDFWLNLKEAYDLFERTHIPPAVSICDRKYVIANGESPPDGVPPPGYEAAVSGMCAEPADAEVATASLRTKRAGRAYRLSSRTHRGRFMGRNVRKNYAAARRARMAAYAKRMRTAASRRDED